MCQDVVYIFECGHVATSTYGIDRCKESRDSFHDCWPREAISRLFPGIQGLCDRCERESKKQRMTFTKALSCKTSRLTVLAKPRHKPPQARKALQWTFQSLVRIWASARSFLSTWRLCGSLGDGKQMSTRGEITAVAGWEPIAVWEQGQEVGFYLGE